jgi:flagellar basal-body rod protein FlgB
VSDLTLGAIHAALSGLSARQRLIAENLSNAETPGYLAENVDFESSLRNAMNSGDLAKFGLSSSRSVAPTGPNGNNVNVDEQTVALIDTGLRYQLMTQAANNEFHILHTAIQGQ